MRLRIINQGKEIFDRERRISERKRDCEIRNIEREAKKKERGRESVSY